MENQKLFIRLAVSAFVVILFILFIQQMTSNYSFALLGGPDGLSDRITYLNRHYDNSSVCGSAFQCHTFQQNLCISQQQLQRNNVGPLIQVETLLSLGPSFSSHPILAIQTEYRQLQGKVYRLYVQAANSCYVALYTFWFLVSRITFI